ncbi:hypothetical protein V1477_015914, partial [Vespula maculifrons]
EPQNQKEPTEEHDMSKNKNTNNQHSSHSNEKSNQFVVVKDVLSTPLNNKHVHEESIQPDADQSQMVFQTAEIKKEAVSKNKPNKLIQEHKFTTATSVKKEKELKTVTRIENDSCDYSIIVYA